MTPRPVHGWDVEVEPGLVRFQKDEHVIETTFNPDEPLASDFAYEHALAQAWSIDNPEEEKSIREGSLEPGSPPVEQTMMRRIRAWERQG